MIEKCHLRIGRKTSGSCIRILTTVFAATLWLLASESPARAQTYLCPPPPEGVFGLPGPPRFLDSPPPDTFASQLDDPRWNGSFREDFATVSSTEAGVRLLIDGNFLYISLEAKVDPDGAVAGSDTIYLGFSRDGTIAEMVKVVMSAAPPLTNSASVSSVSWWKTTDGGATPWPPQAPGALTWANLAFHAWSGTGTGQGDAWAINGKIDLSAVGAHLDGGAPLTSNFFMWYEVKVQTPGGPVPYDWPAGTTLGFDAMNRALLQVSGGAWGNVYPTMASNCPTGISIDPMHIGVLPLMSGFPTQQPHFGTGHAPNDFVAELDNGGASVPNGTVKARFRIANWGSMIGVGGDWHDMIPSPGGGVPGTRNNVGTQVLFHCVNPPDVSDVQCYQVPAGAPLDQCLLVELSQAAGSGVRFLHDSARRNMDFVNASSFERSAEISVRELPPLPAGGGKRDVYIYVRTLHMAESVDKWTPPEIPPPVPPPPPPNPDIAGRPNQPPPKQGEPPRYRMSSYERIASVFPTYEIHVYHDTGRTRTEDGHTYKVLEPQAPFGYFVNHQGDLAGWKHQLVGEGFVLEEISPNFYHAKIPDNGSVKVHTKIDTCQKYVFGLIKCCCNLADTRQGGEAGSFGAIGLVLLAIVRRRKTGATRAS